MGNATGFAVAGSEMHPLILAIKSLMPSAMFALLSMQPNTEDSLNDVVEDVDGALE